MTKLRTVGAQLATIGRCADGIGWDMRLGKR